MGISSLTGRKAFGRQRLHRGNHGGAGKLHLRQAWHCRMDGDGSELHFPCGKARSPSRTFPALICSTGTLWRSRPVPSRSGARPCQDRGRGLIPCSDWDLRTKGGKPVAYRVSISEAGGGTTETLLAGEVLHLRIGADPAAPWLGTAPLRRASRTAGMLQAIESALAEVYEYAPLGSQVVPMPEQPEPTTPLLPVPVRERYDRNGAASGLAAPGRRSLIADI